MRVLHVIPSISPRRGGPSEAVLRMVEAQLGHGIETEIATSDEDRPGVVRAGKLVLHADLPVRFFPREPAGVRIAGDYAFCASFAPWLGEHLHSYDVLHVHALFSHLPTTAMRLARRAGLPYLSRPLGQLGRWPLRQSAWKKALYLRLIENRNLRGAAALHFVSSAEQEEAEELHLSTPGVVIPHGVNLPRENPVAGQILRHKLGVADERRIVLFLGRLHAKKGLDLLLRALALLPTPRPLLLVAGEGPERAALEQLARELDIAADIQWLGPVDGDWKQLCLQGADLFALTSHHENLGVAVLEALAAGTPVLVSPQVALAETVAGHDLGLVAPLDPPAIAQAVQRGLAPSPAGQRGKRREFIGRNFSWTANARALAGLYQHVAKRSR